jgi:oligoendopeptidase F
MAEEKKVKKLPARNEIPVEFTWDLEKIFATDDDWKQEFEDIQALLPKADRFQGRLGESADTLYEALKFQDEVMLRLGKLYTYAHMRYDQDTTNSHYQAMNSRAKIYIRNYPVP